jgi:hypothetical protein
VVNIFETSVSGARRLIMMRREKLYDPAEWWTGIGIFLHPGRQSEISGSKGFNGTDRSNFLEPDLGPALNSAELRTWRFSSN